MAHDTERAASGDGSPSEVTARTGSGTRCGLGVIVVCLVR